MERPRQRKIPEKLGGGSNAASVDAKQHYRILFNEFVDKILHEMQERYTPNANSDLAEYKALADILKTSSIPDDSIIDKYPELNKIALKFQVASFTRATKTNTVYAAKKAYQDLAEFEKPLYPQVFQLLKILLVCPVTSAVCERSFSNLRRLKTWLRSTLGQERLNSNIVCSIHKELLMEINMYDIANNFSMRSAIRRNMFGVNKFL